VSALRKEVIKGTIISIGVVGVSGQFGGETKEN